MNHKCSSHFPMRQWLVTAILVAFATSARAESTTPGTAGAKPRIGISKFEVDADLKPSLCNFLYNGFMDQMVKSKQFTVVDWEEIDRVLQYVAKSQPNLSPEDARKQAIHQLGLEKMYLGSLSKVGSKFYITMKILNLDLTVERTDRVSAVSEDDLEKAVVRLADALLGREKTPEKAETTAQGSGAQKDSQEVAQYRKAAEKGDASAMTYLGYMYANAKGVAQDDAQAVAWYRKAAKKGSAVAQEALRRLGAN